MATNIQNALAEASALIQQGRINEGAGLVQRILSANPTSSQAHYLLGYMYYQASRWAEAFQEFEKALAFDSSNANAAYFLGEIAQKNKNEALAKQYFQKAVELNPGHASALQALSQLQGSPHHPPQTHSFQQGVPASAHVPGPQQTQQPPPQRPATAPPSMGIVETMLADAGTPVSIQALDLMRKLNMTISPRKTPYLVRTFVRCAIPLANLWVVLGIILFGVNAQQKQATLSLTPVAYYQHGGGHAHSPASPHSPSPSPSVRNHSTGITTGSTTQSSGNNQSTTSKIVLTLTVISIALLLVALLFRAWMVSLMKITISDFRIAIEKGFFRSRENIEMLRLRTVDIHQTLLSKLTGDGILTLHYMKNGKPTKLALLGIAKYGRLQEIQDDFRGILPLVENPTFRGITGLQ
jgi:TPR repeat protein